MKIYPDSTIDISHDIITLPSINMTYSGNILGRDIKIEYTKLDSYTKLEIDVELKPTKVSQEDLLYSNDDVYLELLKDKNILPFIMLDNGDDITNIIEGIEAYEKIKDTNSIQ